MASWAQAIFPFLGGLMAASGAFLGVLFTIKGNDRATVQRDSAARREEWWRRCTFAMELAMDSDPRRRAYGLDMMRVLAGSELAGPDEWEILGVFENRLLENELGGEGKEER